jgi:anthranilate synthase component 1
VIARAVLPDEALLGLHLRFPDRYPVLLESVAGDAPIGRHDVLFAWPGERLVLRADGGLEGPAAHGHTRFLDALDAWFEAARAGQVAPATEPFGGGWFLYLGYELATEIEPTLRLPPPRHARAIAWRMHGAVVRDRTSGAVAVHGEGPVADALRARLEEDLARVRADPGATDRAVQPDLLQEEPPGVFLRGVEEILAAIARGDVYQANLSRGWHARLPRESRASDLYARLRHANPAPFSGIARLPGFTVLSSSPERLLRVRHGMASTRPIAGTRPRGATTASDETLREELKLNEKERAEHVMLVDLERNDLGRICRGGTVQVDEFMTIESYATVHHIVSNVSGELRPEVTPGQAIAAVFPGGTITGCPKIRCMQLLTELEAAPRDAYTGSMGYLALDGSLDLNILIRTLTVSGDHIEFRTGAGIVADSRPVAELEETRAKARGLLRALGSAA